MLLGDVLGQVKQDILYLCPQEKHDECVSLREINLFLEQRVFLDHQDHGLYTLALHQRSESRSMSSTT